MSSPQNVEPVRVELAQKESDLVLAAELGKALLQRNEELKRQNEAMANEYQDNIEVVQLPFDKTSYI